jgi:hypothetical protein
MIFTLAEQIAQLSYALTFARWSRQPAPAARRFRGASSDRGRSRLLSRGYRWFESISLQRRVHCELAPHGFGASVIGQQLALRGEAISPSGPTY